MPTRIGIVGRDADQAMDARFSFQIAVCVVSIYFEGGAFDAGAFAGLQVGEVGFEVAALCPSQVQPKQHLGPVLGLHAAGPRMNRDDRTEAIVFPAEHHLQLLAL